VFYLVALTVMPLADVVSIAFAGPLFLTALAVPLLGEPVGWRRWSAVLVGFAGILVMFRPGSETLHWIALLPLVGALLSAFRDIITRRLTATVAVTET
jgi:drug/metabolite transporter (DMT)-like permease